MSFENDVARLRKVDELAVEHGLRYDTSYKVKVTKLPSDAEIEAIKAAALNEVDCM